MNDKAEPGSPVRSTDGTRLIDLSHTVEDGLITHKGRHAIPLISEEVTRAVIAEVIRKFDACVAQIAHCLAQLSEDQVWWRPHESMNSIGNLLLHLTGRAT